MATRPPIQAVIEEQAELDVGRRNWRMVLFNEDGTPFSAGGAGGGLAEEVADLTLAAGWQNLSGREPVRRIKHGRLVTLSGVVQAAGAKGDSAVVGSLPVGWRPANDEIFGGFGYFAVVAGYGQIRWDVEADGDVVIHGAMADTNWFAVKGSFLVPA